ncbi:DUF3540 domain-containing protein [Vibrio gazogenes]|uniref:DUF3540 domain-containing protein n=1 Tax=Vibrio gazogenes TaxID=687 RepID=A0A1Z2SJQ3_VIBGA|nr:DUF3540 domain-containing protein [Vibrio gazogenes]ASA57327.1 hypothetical protein BSQ33_16200 [Vibrio gazogenes]
MNSSLKISQYLHPTPMPENYIGVITRFDPQQYRWEINQNFLAQVATSLLVKPEIGDLVAFIIYQEEYIITQILQRTSAVRTTLQSQDEMCWIAPKVSIQAQDELEMVAFNTVSITSNNLLQSVRETSLQQAQTLIQHAAQVSMTADEVMNLTAKQQMLIAEEEVRIDGERINMG